MDLRQPSIAVLTPVPVFEVLPKKTSISEPVGQSLGRCFFQATLKLIGITHNQAGLVIPERFIRRTTGDFAELAKNTRLVLNDPPRKDDDER
jgi:hypothetical protein